MTGRVVGNIVTSLVWLGGSGRYPMREVNRSPCAPSEHPFKDGTFYSNFGGSAIRYDKVPGALGVLESPDKPLPIGIALRIEWAEPRAWRCSGSRSTWQISPGGGCAKTDGSCWSKSERGRGAGDALAKKGRARYCLTPMGACSPWGGQGSRGPVCRPQRVRDDPHPTGPRPRPSPRPRPPYRSAS